MTWQNLPCAPTLPALFAACPHGWAEIEFTYQAGNPTADPPQDADCSLEVRCLWGIENSDEPALVDLLEDLQEPPLGMPMRDCILLARMEHHIGPCNVCERERRPDEPQDQLDCVPGAAHNEQGPRPEGARARLRGRPVRCCRPRGSRSTSRRWPPPRSSCGPRW